MTVSGEVLIGRLLMMIRPALWSLRHWWNWMKGLQKPYGLNLVSRQLAMWQYPFPWIRAPMEYWIWIQSRQRR